MKNSRFGRLRAPAQLRPRPAPIKKRPSEIVDDRHFCAAPAGRIKLVAGEQFQCHGCSKQEVRSEKPEQLPSQSSFNCRCCCCCAASEQLLEHLNIFTYLRGAKSFR